MRRRADAYLAKRLREFERRAVIRILRRVGGNMSAAAAIAGRDRCSFYYLVKRHGIDYRSFRAKPAELVAEVAPVERSPAPPASARCREWFGVPITAD